jgi:uncharacterized protein
VPSNDPAPEEIFRCRRCGECCKGYGGTYVDADDIEAIADFIGVDPAVFKKSYCRTSGGRLLLAQGAAGYCVFWDKLCTIHPVKPRMCRRWPFIQSVLIEPENWRIMAGACPGMRTDLPLAFVRRCVAAQMAAAGRASGGSSGR